MGNFINFLLLVFFYVFAAVDFAMAAKDLLNKKFYWFGFELVTGIWMLICLIVRFLSL